MNKNSSRSKSGNKIKGNQSPNCDKSRNKKIWELKEEPQGRASPTEYKWWKREPQALKIKEIDTLVKENVKARELQAQNIQRIWDTVKRSNL